VANDLNLCIFTGRLGQDPEVRFTSSGTPVANLNLAVGKQWRDKQSGNKQEATSWARCVAFAKTAELAQQYLGKGAMIRVTAEMRENKWQDQNGNNRSSTEFIINDMQFLSGGQSQGGQPQGGQGGYPHQGSQPQGYPQGGSHPPNQPPPNQPPPNQPPPNQPQQQGHNGSPAPGAYDDFDDEIPF
jgi:single-strand DNA-binding protein